MASIAEEEVVEVDNEDLEADRIDAGGEQIQQYLDESMPESDFRTEHFKFQGDILIVKAAVHIYDEIKEKPFTYETKLKLRDLVKDVSDALYRVTKFRARDIIYTMNDLTIAKETLIFSLPRIDVTHHLNFILALIDKMYFAAIKGAEGGFEREAGISAIHRTEQKLIDPDRNAESPEKTSRWGLKRG